MPHHPLVFLIGLHGVGKTTIGRALATEHQYLHVSLGNLGRLLRRRRIPKGYSLRFLRLLAAHEPGERMSSALIQALHSDVNTHNTQAPLVVDGFPAEPYHVTGLPAGCTVVHLTCPDDVRATRLIDREEETNRKWVEGAISDRDRQVAAVAQAAVLRQEIKTRCISTLGSPSEIASDIARWA